MTETLTSQVHAAVAVRMASVAPERAARLRAQDYRPQRRARSLLPLLSAGAAAISGAAVAAVLLLSGSTPVAFAGWTATPSLATPSDLAAARSACGNVRLHIGALLAAEARGPYTAIAFTHSGRPWLCVVRGRHVVVEISTRYPERLYAAVPSGKVMLPLISQRAFGKTSARLRSLNNRYQNSNGPASVENKLQSEIAATLSGPGTLTATIGLAGPGVRSVTFVLADGDRVQATVEQGWYVAWWPGAPRRGGGTAVRVRVVTAAGGRTSRLPTPPKLDVGYRVPARGCVPGDHCSVFVPLELVAEVAPSLAAHYSMFRSTPPVKASRWPEVVRFLIQRFSGTGRFRGDKATESREMQNGMGAGLDPAQVRSLDVGMGNTLWLIPGSQDFCTSRVGKGGDGGAGCGPVSSLNRYGAITNPGTTTRGGVTHYYLGGFVPDGNRSVTVRVAGGAPRMVAIRHNAFKASFLDPPVSITFRDSAGKLVTDPAPAPNEV